jgi:hypothetical protein
MNAISGVRAGSDKEALRSASANCCERRVASCGGHQVQKYLPV